MLFRCAECGGPVVPKTGVGRTFRYRRNDERPIPDDMLIPTCERCGDDYFTDAISEALDKLCGSRPVNGGEG